MRRRFVYRDGAVVEVTARIERGSDPDRIWAEAKAAHDASPWGADASKDTAGVIDAARDRADRREWAHRRFGDESRYRE